MPIEVVTWRVIDHIAYLFDRDRGGRLCPDNSNRFENHRDEPSLVDRLMIAIASGCEFHHRRMLVERRRPNQLEPKADMPWARDEAREFSAVF